MLMANMPEALLDRFLAAMNENGIKIGHKAIVTDYNIEYEFHQLIDDIEDEHQTFQKLIELNNLVNDAKKLNESEYGNKPEWSALRSAISDAQTLMSTEEPSYEELENAVKSRRILSGVYKKNIFKRPALQRTSASKVRPY